jgi:hypothetical protein
MIAALQSMTAAALDQALHPQFVCFVLPSTLSIPARHKRDYVPNIVATLQSLFASWSLTYDANQALLSSDGKRVHFHAVSQGRGRVSGRPYSQEYSLQFELERDEHDGQTKVKAMWEFVDSEYSRVWFTEERKAVAALAR